MTPMRPDKELIKLLNGWPNDPRGADYSVKSIQDLMRQAADRLEALSGGEAVASSAYVEAAEPFFRLAREVINPADYERPWHADSADGMVVFSFAGQSVTLGDLRRAAALAAPRPMPGREEVARVIEPWAMEFNGYNALAAYKKQEALKLADSILSLFSASLGGREAVMGKPIAEQKQEDTAC